MKCKICGCEDNYKTFLVRERMLGIGDEFEYFECSNCMCIQIIEVPSEIEKYYPTDYYSFKDPEFATKMNPIRFVLKKSLVKHSIGQKNLLGFLLSHFYNNPFPWFIPGSVDFNSKILDVGCGAGRLLLSLQRSGFKSLTGIDPFNKDDIYYENGVTVYKKEIFELDEKFDLIMLHHSFEHMWNQELIMNKICDLVKDEGYIIIRIPVSDCYAWRKYHSCWVQLDAPRHYFIHSIKSMKLLSQSCNLNLVDIKFDSNHFQFTGSEKYLLGLKLFDDNKLFSDKQIQYFDKEALRLNSLNDGDSACFYFKKRS